MSRNTASQTPASSANRSRGSDSLSNAYSLIAEELLKYHRAARLDSYAAFAEFRESLVFIQTEILESYLEDLLNPCVTARRLHLDCGEKKIGSLLRVLTASCVFVVALNWFVMNLPLVSVTLIGSVLALSLMLLWKCLPQVLFAQRMKSARVVSKEISRRRGKGNGREGRIGAFLIEELLGTQKGGLQGVAKVSLGRSTVYLPYQHSRYPVYRA